MPVPVVACERSPVSPARSRDLPGGAVEVPAGAAEGTEAEPGGSVFVGGPGAAKRRLADTGGERLGVSTFDAGRIPSK